MSDCTKRYMIAAILLLVTAFTTFGAYSTRSYSGVLYTQIIPVTIGDWHSRDLPVSARTYDILETKDIITREYSNSRGDRVFLSVVFARSNRKVAHPPEVCFAGGGWSRIDRDDHSILINGKPLRFNRLVLQRGSERQIAMYLYKSGKRLTNNFYAQQLNIILNGMLHRNVSSALIRVSSYSASDDIEKSTELAGEFAKKVIPIIEDRLP